MTPETLNTNPIFIVGSPRSGTTLLRLMLASHPLLCIPPESLFFVSLERKYGNAGNLSDRIDSFLYDLYRDTKFAEWKVDRERLSKNLKSVSYLDYSTTVSIVYRTYMEQYSPESQIWGDKNPYYLYHIDTILKHFPSARFIHIVRDIRAVYSSLASVVRDKKANKFWKNIKTPLFYATRRWAQAVHVVENYKDHNQIYTIYFEKLTSNPETELTDLCSWLGLRFSPDMLCFYKENAEKELVPAHRLRWHQRTLEPVAQERINGWKNEIDISETQAVELMNAKRMKRLGYERLTTRCGYKGWMKILSECFQLILQKAKI